MADKRMLELYLTVRVCGWVDVVASGFACFLLFFFPT